MIKNVELDRALLLILSSFLTSSFVILIFVESVTISIWLESNVISCLSIVRCVGELEFILEFWISLTFTISFFFTIVEVEESASNEITFDIFFSFITFNALVSF